MDPRKSYRIVLFLLLSGLIFNAQVAEGQIYSNSASTSKSIKYDSYDGNDKLFAFYQTHGSFRSGSLSVDSPEGNGTFTWTKYDHNTDAFSIPVDVIPNEPSSTINDLDEGGYQVEITYGGTLDTTFTAWVMLDNFTVETENDDGYVPHGNSGCAQDNYLFINGFVVADSFFYYDLVTHDSIAFQNDYTFEWTIDNSEVEIFNATRTLHLEQVNIVPLPVEDTYFILTATDSLGMTEVDSVLYDTKFTRAEFTMNYYDKITQLYESDLTESWSLDKGSLDAPLTVQFINESENGARYTWVFLDSFNVAEDDGLKISMDTTEIDFQPEFTYYNADKYYYPYLVSLSDAGCRDTFKLEDGIRVVPSDLAIPNVFSPNGDTQNDVFLFKHQSLKEFKLTIINKFGRVVYRQKIDDIYLWEGWKGTILNSDRPAPEGQYYYIVEALGYDNVEYQDPNVIERWKIERQQGGSGSTPPTTGTGTDPQVPSNNIYTGWLYLYRYSGDY